MQMKIKNRPDYLFNDNMVANIKDFDSNLRDIAGYLKCGIRGTNNQIRNRFYKSVHLQLFNIKYKFVFFNCLTSNINLFNFNCLMSNFCFPKNIFFASRRERVFMDARPLFRVFNSTGKMMNCYLCA